MPRSAEAVKHHVAEWLEGFPDLSFSVEQMLAEADHVVSRSVMHGTHTGTWMGIAPTGKQVSIRMFVDHKIVNGKIVEDWVLVEALGFFQQLEILASTQEILLKAAK
ncbi:MAG TPA: ester cyclase [Pyrinomonadaceae bacterium]|nr:ester cyclase [Pyrinomonadaceae bacterium]